MSSAPVNGQGSPLHPLPDMRSATSTTSGVADNQSLTCRESMLSTSPPPEGSAGNAFPASWKTVDSDNNNLPSVEKLVAARNELGNEEKLMNSGGPDRMTGPGTNNSKDSWLTQVAQQQQSHALIRGGERDVPHTMLPLSAATGGGQTSVFRPPMTVADRGHMMYASQFPQTVYTTTVGSLQRYSETLYTPHSQQGSLSSLHQPYYYPAGYQGYQGRPALMPHDYPSYSAVLASMGSHVQSQLPRSAFPLPLPHQYPHHAGGGSQRSSSQSSSQHPLLVDAQRQHARSHSLTRDNTDFEGRGGSAIAAPSLRTVSPKAARDRKHLSPPVHEPRPDPRRSPDRREQRLSSSSSSLKQRILAPPTNISVESTQISESAYRRVGERSPKRPRSDIGQPPPLQPTHQSSSSCGGASSSAQSSHLPPPPPPPPSSSTTTYPSQPHFPPHFNKGSIIQLASGEMKRVEDLRTEDFVTSADQSSDLKIDSSTVVRIEQQLDKGTAILGFSVGEHRVQVTVEATVEHPFYVFGRGWSSCQPQRTFQRFGLDCSQLEVGDVCISLTHKHVQASPTLMASATAATTTTSDITMVTAAAAASDASQESGGRKRRWSAPDQLHVEDKQSSPAT